jgi:hypothetical protein
VYEAKGDVQHALDEWSAYVRMDCCSPYSVDVAKVKILELQKAEAKLVQDTPTEPADPAAPPAEPPADKAGG